MSIPAFFNWSGGKDSAFALYKALQDESFEIKCLFTTLSEATNRVSMHGVREALIERQAESIGIPLIKIWLPELASMLAR